ncbi:adenine phosphoribosyltransferase 5-like [Triticum dicoccoides]|uniref:adenine phosphoribosyltransferase 5-like n=1 Tax=Triticum dicoccoides TaxID=85692 RepID=UPI00188FB53F|nr:adenine phosphoribosyltransferase 5-like [Triticum dicoccoides]
MGACACMQWQPLCELSEGTVTFGAGRQEAASRFAASSSERTGRDRLVLVGKRRLRALFVSPAPLCRRSGIEARGFIFGPAIALAIGAKFIPLRKPGKLPGAVISENYTLEYGTDCLEMHVGAVEPGDRVVVVDDLVATGGTLSAAIKLLERAAADVVECACLIGLPKFKDFYKLDGKPVYILVESKK